MHLPLRLLLFVSVHYFLTGAALAEQSNEQQAKPQSSAAQPTY